MRIAVTLALLLGAGGCASAAPQRQVSPLLSAAERVIDAFYSFDPVRLQSALVDAPGSQPKLLYYQGWAEGGNYVVVQRKPCRLESDDQISCDITVRDDLIAALGTGYWVTDTFHLTVRDGHIVKVRNSSNDPPDFDQATAWVMRERPAVMTGPCTGFFAGGPTPQDCVRAMVAGFAAYRTANPRR